MAQSGKGRIEIFEDFLGGELPAASTVKPSEQTAALLNFNSALIARGDVIESTDAEIVPVADKVDGVARFIAAHVAEGDAIFLGTETCFSVGLQGTIIIEARLEMQVLTARRVFVGLCGNYADAQTNIATGSTDTLTLTESDLCGFLFDSGLSEAVNWYMVFNGGTTTGELDASEVASGVIPVATEMDILRLEVANNGTVRWYINGVLKQTIKGAISTSVMMSALIGVIATTTTEPDVDVDYFMVRANRDWTR